MSQQAHLEDPRTAKKRKLVEHQVPSLDHLSSASSNDAFLKARSSGATQYSSSLFNRSSAISSPHIMSEDKVRSKAPFWRSISASLSLSLWSTPAPSRRFSAFSQNAPLPLLPCLMSLSYLDVAHLGRLVYHVIPHLTCLSRRASLKDATQARRPSLQEKANRPELDDDWTHTDTPQACARVCSWFPSFLCLFRPSINLNSLANLTMLLSHDVYL